jgi:hypothetical protein
MSSVQQAVNDCTYIACGSILYSHCQVMFNYMLISRIIQSCMCTSLLLIRWCIWCTEKAIYSTTKMAKIANNVTSVAMFVTWRQFCCVFFMNRHGKLLVVYICFNRPLGSNEYTWPDIVYIRYHSSHSCVLGWWWRYDVCPVAARQLVPQFESSGPRANWKKTTWH